MAQSTIQTQLCPYCANSIGADELKCPYCKAELSPIPQWPEREDRSVRFVPRPEKQRLTVKSKAILGFGLLVFTLGVYLVGAQQQRSDLEPTLAIKQQEIEERDQKLKSVQEELDQLRQQSQTGTSNIEQLTKNLKASETELAATRNRLAAANREIDRLSSTRAAPPARSRAANPAPAAPVPNSARRGADAGLYEIVRPTTVFEEPTISARILSRINKGTQVNVVRSGSEWLEIRSNRGNPAGFIRADDATLVSRAN